jgi:hypothetical protein
MYILSIRQKCDTRKIKGICLHAEVGCDQLLCSCMNIAVLALLQMFPIQCVVFQELFSI